MAYKNRKTAAGDVIRDVPLGIQDPRDADHRPAGDLLVTGSGSPDTTSTVTGMMTDVATGNSFQSNPLSCTIGGTFGGVGLPTNTWKLAFQNIPPGTYVLAVQQSDPPAGADAITVTIDPLVVPITITTIAGTPANPIVSGTCDPTTTVSGVIATRPVHGTPRTQSGSSTFTIRFRNVARGDHTITVYPLRGGVKGDSRPHHVP